MARNYVAWENIKKVVVKKGIACNSAIFYVLTKENNLYQMYRDDDYDDKGVGCYLTNVRNLYIDKSIGNEPSLHMRIYRALNNPNKITLGKFIEETKGRIF